MMTYGKLRRSLDTGNTAKKLKNMFLHTKKINKSISVTKNKISIRTKGTLKAYIIDWSSYVLQRKICHFSKCPTMTMFRFSLSDHSKYDSCLLGAKEEIV